MMNLTLDEAKAIDVDATDNSFVAADQVGELELEEKGEIDEDEDQEDEDMLDAEQYSLDDLPEGWLDQIMDFDVSTSSSLLSPPQPSTTAPPTPQPSTTAPPLPSCPPGTVEKDGKCEVAAVCPPGTQLING